MHLISDYSLWFVIPIAILSAVLTLFFYKKEGWFADMKVGQQNLLRSLRFGSIFLVGILLLGLILQAIHYREEKPVFITLIDNSNSMLNYRDSGQVKDQIEQFRKEFNEKYANRFELIEMHVESEASNGKLNFKDKTSNLEAGFEKINVD